MSRMASRVCTQCLHTITKSGRSNNRILMLIGQINAIHSAESVEADLFVKSGWPPPASFLLSRPLAVCRKRRSSFREGYFHAHLRRRHHRLGHHDKLSLPVAFPFG